MKKNMRSRMDELLRKIDPSKTIGLRKQKMDLALMQYTYGSGEFRNFNEFCSYLARFYCNIESVCISRRIPVNVKMDYFRCAQILIEEYGPKGEQIAFEMVNTGVDGSLYSILNLIAGKTVHNYSRNIVRSHVDKFIRSLSFNQKLEAAEEYKRRFRQLLPPAYVNSNIALLTANLEKILEEHPFQIQRLHRRFR